MSKKLKKKKKKRKDLLVNRLVRIHFGYYQKKFIQNYFNVIDLDETESSDWELINII